MEPEYAAAMREHVALLTEELDQLHALSQGAEPLSPLLYRAAERNLQLLTEACIGIAKQRLKALGKVVPNDARQAFERLRQLGHDSSNVPWRKVVGLRNALVHDYLNLDPAVVLQVIQTRDYRQLEEFARAQLE